MVKGLCALLVATIGAGISGGLIAIGLPLFILRISIPAADLQGAPAHGGGVFLGMMFITVPLGIIVFLCATPWMTVALYRLNWRRPGLTCVGADRGR
jgi:hypothetical protein